MLDFIDRQATMNVVGLTTDAIKINPIETKYVDAQGNELVAVVRCKDCIYDGDHGDGEMACAMMILYPNKPTDYCSLGERKEDAKEE